MIQTTEDIHSIFSKHCNNTNNYWSNKFIFNYGYCNYMQLTKKKIKSVLYWNNMINNSSIGVMFKGISANGIKAIIFELLNSAKTT